MPATSFPVAGERAASVHRPDLKGDVAMQMQTMARHRSSAPVVHFPLCRSRVLGWALGALALLGMLVLLAWLASGVRDHLAAKSVAGAVLWVASAGMVFRFWCLHPKGMLMWDGGQWLLEESSDRRQGLVSAPQVLIDAQSWMALQVIVLASGRNQWLWLERRQAPGPWADLRRAVYSRALLDSSVPTGTVI
ncbi:hypothetical protein [Diaphorobacter sp.]|uniref:hypothetical protein n=1 Tax=Diaphorobacter sp. TaxID=1934310 RepID=UPI0028AA73B8|nr:hypothetical protein [Diaphorobacter sp.]